MNELVETRQLKGNFAINFGRYYTSDIKTHSRISEYKTLCEKVIYIPSPYRQVFWKMDDSENTATIYTGNFMYLNEAITDCSTLIRMVYNEDKLINCHKETKIYSNYIKILEAESLEQALVYLYTSLIDLTKDPRSCEVFLENINAEILSVDSIVHILNALSLIKSSISNWNVFVERALKKLIELEGEENAKDLLSVIL